MPSFLNSKLLERSIFLFGEVWTYSAEDIVQKLLEMNKENDSEPINFIINSPGGVVYDMFSIVDTMNLIKAPIHTYVIGLAASAASVIASCGEKRFITENSQFMLHEVSSGAFGNIANMKDQMEQIEELNNKFLSVLAKNTGKDIETLKKNINKTDLFLNAKESVKFGLCDEIIKEKAFAEVKLSEVINVDAKEIDEDLKTIHLLQVGRYQNTKFGTLNIDIQMITKMKENFDSNVRGQEISLDYTHDNDNGEKKAGAWIKDLFIRDNGLYATVEYTPVAREMIKNEEYKYVSAEFVFNYKTQNDKSYDCVLFGGTFTNRPVLKGLDVLKLSETNINENNVLKMKVKLEDIKATLKSDHNIDVDALLKAKDQVATLEAEKEELAEENKNLNEQNSELEGQKEGLEKEKEELESSKEEAEKELEKIKEKEVQEGKEAEVEALIKKGIILTAQKERVLAQFKSKEAIQEFYKDAPAILNIKPQGSNSLDEDPKVSSKLQKLANESKLSTEELKKYSK